MPAGWPPGSSPRGWRRTRSPAGGSSSRARSGAAGAGVGRRGCGGPAAPADHGADRGGARVSRGPGRKIWICDPGDPEAKGLVERANGYLETSFLPGRTFASPADFNAQLGDWLAVVNQRPRRALGCAPADRIEADRAAMLPMPPGRATDRVAGVVAAAARPLRA